MAPSDIVACFAPMNTLMSEQRSFEFFGLPRELRDYVSEYMCTLGAEQYMGAHHHLDLVLQYVPTRDLFLVNRQFKHELEDMAGKAVSLVVTD